MQFILTDREKEMIEDYNSGKMDDRRVKNAMVHLLGDDITKRNTITITLEIKDIMKANRFIDTIFSMRESWAKESEEVRTNIENTGVEFKAIEYDPKLHDKAAIFDGLLSVLRQNCYEIMAREK